MIASDSQDIWGSLDQNQARATFSNSKGNHPKQGWFLERSLKDFFIITYIPCMVTKWKDSNNPIGATPRVWMSVFDYQGFITDSSEASCWFRPSGFPTPCYENSCKPSIFCHTFPPLIKVHYICEAAKKPRNPWKRSCEGWQTLASPSRDIRMWVDNKEWTEWLE